VIVPTGAFTVSEILVECVRLPDTPVTVTVAVPVVAFAATVNVNVLVEVAGFGLKPAVTPDGSVPVVKLTLPLKPLIGLIVIVLVPVWPCVIASELGFADRLKSGFMTVRETVVVCVKEPDTPVIVTVVVPVAAVAPTVNVRVLVLVVGFGLKAAVTPDGSAELLKVTLPLKPSRSLTVIVLVPVAPCFTVSEFGFALRAKSGVPQPGKLKLPIAVLQLNPLLAPVVFIYDSVNQNVQSSVGSIVIEL
jgi:hypothetical protein